VIASSCIFIGGIHGRLTAQLKSPPLRSVKISITIDNLPIYYRLFYTGVSIIYAYLTTCNAVWSIVLNRLIDIHLTPYPSPARTILNEREYFLAGEGSKEERGRSPLSKTSSPFQTNE
jgi:hypothetical protein